MSLLLKVALLAYPPQFRRRFGTEWTRAMHDRRVHGNQSAGRLAATVVTDVFLNAPPMRWETLTTPSRALLSIAAITVALAALAVGSPAIGILLIALIVVFALQAVGAKRPIAGADLVLVQRWYLWLAAAAGSFLVGLVVVIIDNADDLTTVGWATWLLTWSAAVVLAITGLALGATRLVLQRR